MRITKVLAAIAGLLLVAGVVVVLTAPPTSFGWFAYAPLPGDATRPYLDEGPGPWLLPLALGDQQVVGIGLGVLGLVVAGVALGTRLGRGGAR